MKTLDVNEYIVRYFEEFTDPEMAEAITNMGFPITANGVRKRRENLKLKRTRKLVRDIAPERRTIEERVGDHRKDRDHRATRRENREMLERLTSMEEELEAFRELGAAKETHAIKAGHPSDTSEATAVCLLSDWHVEEQVKPEWVNEINEYDLDIAKARANQCFQRIARMVKKERQDVEINELILWLGGDFFSGRIHEELLETCLLGPIQAAIYAQELIESGIEYLLKKTNLRLTIVTSVGNHSRITKSVHHATERANSLESYLYYSLASRFRDETRVTFVIRDSYHTYVDIYGFLARFHHGTRIRYYSAIGGIHTNVAKYVLKANKGLGRIPDWDFFGHHHTYLPVASGAGNSGYIVNGSMIGTTPYGMAFGSEPPRQAFFLVDKKRGITVTIPILFEV